MFIINIFNLQNLQIRFCIWLRFINKWSTNIQNIMTYMKHVT